MTLAVSIYPVFLKLTLVKMHWYRTMPSSSNVWQRLWRRRNLRATTSMHFPGVVLRHADIPRRYFCSHCNELQEAKRYTELRELPPVLHFSLLRFIYDFSTTERKKSKHVIQFPKSLDMDQFMDPGPSGGKKRKHSAGNMYQLRGVLMHRGPSAYHGHYETQIYDLK